MGALSAGLALPFSFAPIAYGMSGDRFVAPTAADFIVRQSTLDRWHNYALAAITPAFNWALVPDSFGPPGVIDDYTGERPLSGRFSERGRDRNPLSISLATHRVFDTPGVLPDQGPRLFDGAQTGLQRTVVAPSLAVPFGERGDVRITGLLASQRFASLGFGTGEAAWLPLSPRYRDSSRGVGARIDVGNALGDRLRWTFGYQSRVALGTFNSYQGVFADPGDFDIPASENAALDFAITPKIGIDLGVQRVFYSAITPFASSGLPTRFLALLGDSSSPVFAWRDLDVYSVGTSLRSDSFGSWQLRYTTRQQPVPTSHLLENALSSAVANRVVALGWSMTTGADSAFNVIASYADSSYYLLLPTALRNRDATAGQVEFEAQWSVRF